MIPRDHLAPMDSRFRERQCSIGRQRGRRRATLLFLLVVLLGSAVAFLWLRSSDVFAVRTVTVTATHHVSRQEISRATSDALGQSLLRISTGSLEEALLALPYVRSAEVHRSFPNSLDIVLEEHEPAARVQAGGGPVWLVADTGRVLGRDDAPGHVDLPLVKTSISVLPTAGELLPADMMQVLPLVSLLRQEDTGGALPEVQFVALTSKGELTLQLKVGTEVRLGEPSGLEQKLMVAAVIVERCLRDGVPPEYVDVSVPDRVAVKAR